MKILLPNPDGGAFLYIMRGFKNALKHAGHSVKPWDGERESFEQFEPDIYIGCSGWRQPIPHDLVKKFNTRIVIHVNPYGSINLEQISNGPNINEPQNTIEWVKDQKPDLLFGYGYGQEDIDKYWNKWLSISDVVMAAPAADHIEYYQVDHDHEWAHDLAFVGGRWGYKATNIDKYLVPLLPKYDVGIYGWGGWQPIRKSQKIDDNDVRKLFSSSKIGPCIHEPHSSVYGIDVPERVFKVPLCGLLAISDQSASLHRYFPKDIMPMAETPQQYEDFIKYYLKHDMERKEIALKQKNHILQHHTYLNRVSKIFEGLGLNWTTNV